MSFYTDNNVAVSYVALLHGCRGLQCHPALIVMVQYVHCPSARMQGVKMPSYTDSIGGVRYIALLHGCRGLQCHPTLIIMA